MSYGIDMKRLHQGCGESLQANLPGFPFVRRTLLADLSEGQRDLSHRVRLKSDNPRAESEYR
ncbi:MAG: hypothetical protein ABW092_06690 [Candidatus Thiodiazotropha sp.]